MREIKLPFAIVEANYDNFKKLDAENLPAIFGDATKERILLSAGIEQAKLIVITVSSAVASRNILLAVQKVRPDVKVILRIQYLKELESLTSLEQTGGSATVLGTNVSTSGLTNIDGGSFAVASFAAMTATGGIDLASGVTSDIFGGVTGAIANAGVLNFGGAVTGAVTNAASGTLAAAQGGSITGALENSGMVSIRDQDTLSVGSYIATSGSTTEFGLSDATSGVLSATGTIAIQSGADLAIDVATGATIAGGQTYSLARSGAGAAMSGTVSDNSALYDFDAVVQGDDIILTADTVVALGRRILDKPADAAAAEASLRLLSGRRHKVITALCLRRGARAWTRRVETQVSFKRLSETEIAGYVRSGEWRGKAGGYAIQGRAGAFAPSINGSYTNIVGLPLSQTANLLEAAGWPLRHEEAEA
jgi:MAF protein